jgi:hypothetical protein
LAISECEIVRRRRTKGGSGIWIGGQIGWHIDSDLRGLVETERKRETFERHFNTEPGCELHGKDFADMNDLLQEALNT